jgi:hypothetical protein
MQVTGNVRVFGQNPTRQGNGETFTGTTQMGSRHVIGGTIPRRSNTQRNPNIPQLVGLAMKDPNMDPRRPPSNPDTGTPSDGSE